MVVTSAGRSWRLMTAVTMVENAQIEMMRGHTIPPPPASSHRFQACFGSGDPRIRRLSSSWSAPRKARTPNQRYAMAKPTQPMRFEP